MTMSLPPIQHVLDRNGCLVQAKESQVHSYRGFSYPGFGNMKMEEAQNAFKSFNDVVSSTMKWATIASLGKPLEMFESCMYVFLAAVCYMNPTTCFLSKQRLLFLMFIYLFLMN